MGWASVALAAAALSAVPLADGRKQRDHFTELCGSDVGEPSGGAEAKLYEDFRRISARVSAGWSGNSTGSKRRRRRILAARCRSFRDTARFPHKQLIFTHVPKTGGQSLQTELAKQAAQAGVRSRDLLMGHMRYGDLKVWYPDRMPSADFITMLREPESLLKSDFHYMRRNAHHSSHTYMNRFASIYEWLKADHDDGGGGGLALFSPFPRGNRTLEQLRSFCSRVRWRSQKLRCLCTSAWRDFLYRTMELLAEQYAVIGLLERLDDTFEVLRCRVPWLRELRSMPKHNVRKASPAAAADDKPNALMHRKTFLVKEVHDFAGEILDADLQCCRARAGKRKRG